MIHKNRANRRMIAYTKARRKQRIVHEMNDYWHYKYFGQYRKGKIHCSCPMCAAKTNGKINKSKGPLSSNRSFSRLAVTNGRYGRKNYKMSDKRRIDRLMSDQFAYNGLKD